MVSDELATYDEQAMFYQDLQWFVLHVGAVAESPERASSLHGDFNVAHEFWYFVPRSESILNDPLHLMTMETRAAIARAIEAIKVVPEEARNWTKTKAGSIQNMNHIAWSSAREHAKEVMQLLAPVVAKMHAFFELPNPSFKPTQQTGAA